MLKPRLFLLPVSHFRNKLFGTNNLSRSLLAKIILRFMQHGFSVTGSYKEAILFNAGEEKNHIRKTL